jgi:hypothetical protein
MMTSWIMRLFPETITTARQARLVLAFGILFALSGPGSFWYGFRSRLPKRPPPPIPSRRPHAAQALPAREDHPVERPASAVTAKVPAPTAEPVLVPKATKDDGGIGALELMGYVNDPKSGITALLLDSAGNRYWIRGGKFIGPHGAIPGIRAKVYADNLKLVTIDNKEVAEYSLR